MNKIVVCIMGQDCKDYAELCLESVKEADAIVFCDGGSKEDFRFWLLEQGFWPNNAVNEKDSTRILIERKFDQNDPGNNGKQRNFYLDFLKKKYDGWWALCLDADEVVHDLQKIKDFCAERDYMTVNASYDVHMRHFIYNFGQEDATQERHYVQGRLFKIRDDVSYPEGEHIVLQGRPHLRTDCTTIWHLAYCSQMFNVRSRYRKNLKHSEVHTKNYLEQWRNAHYFGKYPTKKVDPKELPASLLRGMDVDPDEIYFQGRDVEVKHFIDAGHWRDHFKIDNDDSVIEWGCGLGPRIAGLITLGIKAQGIEISQWACKHSFTPNNVIQGDITDPTWAFVKMHKLAVAYDILEHLPYDKLDIAIENLKKSSKNILVSIPTIGDPNLENDPTHIIKEKREWWVEQFKKHGLVEKPVPAHFFFRKQLMIFENPLILEALFG